MLIDEIIDLLSDEKSSLSQALLKTKVLLHKIGKKELVEWVKYELNGYPEGSDLPDYRKLSATVLGNASNGAYRATAHPLPISHLKEETQKNLKSIYFSQPLSVIEDMASKTEGYITRQLPVEYGALFNEALGNCYQVEIAWCQTPLHDVKGILTQIRSRLLDFILELKDTVGDTEDDKTAKKRAEAADTNSMFNNAIFGSNTTILVGDQGNQSVKNFQIKNDITALTELLSEIGVADKDIASLKTAISKDVEKYGNASYEGETGKWYTNLLGRAGKGVVGVGVDVVSTTVGKALAAYIGV